jgi:hypothetical protein
MSGDIVADLAQRAAELDENVVFSVEDLRVKDSFPLDPYRAVHNTALHWIQI